MTPGITLATSVGGAAYQGDVNSNLAAMNAQALALAGGNGAHNNMMPYQTLLFCIALTGIFPARS